MALPQALEGVLRFPLIGAPMFIVSSPELVIAQCNAGIVGSFPALNARPQEMLSDLLKQIEDETGAYKEAHPDENTVSESAYQHELENGTAEV